MNTSLYVLAQEYQEAARALADFDLPDDVLASVMANFAGAVQVKATNVAMAIRNFEATAAAIKEAEQQMARRRHAIESRIDWLRGYLLSAMQGTGITQIECPHFRLAVRENPDAVVIPDPAKLPRRFMRRPPRPAAVPDKRLIADALKAGEKVRGAHLSRGLRLDIK